MGKKQVIVSHPSTLAAATDLDAAMVCRVAAGQPVVIDPGLAREVDAACAAARRAPAGAALARHGLGEFEFGPKEGIALSAVLSGIMRGCRGLAAGRGYLAPGVRQISGLR
jgi:hypothetical protein